MNLAIDTHTTGTVLSKHSEELLSAALKVLMSQLLGIDIKSLVANWRQFQGNVTGTGSLLLTSHEGLNFRAEAILSNESILTGFKVVYGPKQILAKKAELKISPMSQLTILASIPQEPEPKPANILSPTDLPSDLDFSDIEDEGDNFLYPPDVSSIPTVFPNSAALDYYMYTMYNSMAATIAEYIDNNCPDKYLPLPELVPGVKGLYLIPDKQVLFVRTDRPDDQGQGDFKFGDFDSAVAYVLCDYVLGLNRKF